MAKKQAIQTPKDFIVYPEQQPVNDVVDIPADDVDLFEQQEYARAEAARKAKEDEIVKRFYSTYEPAPVLDEKKLDRLQRMGKINALGRGVSVFADALSVGLGGNVNRRNPDQTSPALYAAYQNTLDRHKDKTDIWNSRKYQDDINKMMFEYGLIDKDRRNDQWGRVQAEKEKNANAMLEIKLRQQEIDNAFKAGKLTIDQYKAEMDAMYKKNKNAIDAQKAAQEGEGTEKPFMIAAVNGRDIPIKQGQYRELLNAASNDPGFTNFKALMQNYENNPLETEKNIVQAYLLHLDKQAKAKEESERYVNSLTRPPYIPPGQGNQNTGVRTKKEPATTVTSKKEAKSKWGDYAR